MSRCHCVVAVRRSQQRGMQRAAHMAEALRGARLERQIQTVLDVCSLQMASFAVSTLLLTRPCVCVRALETMGKWWTMSVWMTALMMSLRSSRQRAGSTAASTSALAPPASRPYMAARWRFSSTARVVVHQRQLVPHIHEVCIVHTCRMQSTCLVQT